MMITIRERDNVKEMEYDWYEIENACMDLKDLLIASNWEPDYIVGITRGGAIPAILLSQLLGIPMKPLMVNLRDHEDCTHDLGMAEDAYGYPAEENKKNILIVDDINDSGATIAWIKKSWQEACLPNDTRWNNIWGHNVRFATIVNNIASSEKVDYTTEQIDKSKEDIWVVYPWEAWHRGF